MLAHRRGGHDGEGTAARHDYRVRTVRVWMHRAVGGVWASMIKRKRERLWDLCISQDLKSIALSL